MVVVVVVVVVVVAVVVVVVAAVVVVVVVVVVVDVYKSQDHLEIAALPRQKNTLTESYIPSSVRLNVKSRTMVYINDQTGG